MRACARSKLHGTRKDVQRAIGVQNELRADLAAAQRRIKEIEACFRVTLREQHERRTHAACVELTDSALRGARMDGREPELFMHVARELLGHLRKR